MADSGTALESQTENLESADPLLKKNIGELIDELLEEKKILEEKNKKLAAMLDICAKNSAGASSEAGSSLNEQLLALKKSISNIEKKLEKSITSQSSDQSKAVMNELKTRFTLIDDKIAALESLKGIDKKLEELQAEIHAKRSRGASLFGRLGAIAGGETAEENNDEDEDIITKLDALEEKIEKLSYRVGGGKKAGGEGSDGVVQKVEGNVKKELEKIAAVFSTFGRKAENGVTGFSSRARKSVSGADANAEGDISGSSDKRKPKAEDQAEPAQEKISEEVLENLIFENSGAAGGKMRIKLHEPSDLNDSSKIQEDIRAGNLILVNIKSLRQNDMELLKRMVAQLKRTCYAVNGSITGMGDNYLIVMPKNVQLHKE